MSVSRVLGGFILGFIIGVFASEYLGFKHFLVRITEGGTTTPAASGGNGNFSQIPTPAPPTKQLGRLSKVPHHIRVRVWRLLAHKVDDYIPFDGGRPARVVLGKDEDKNKIKIPAMLLVSRALSDEFAAEFYSVNKVLHFPIDPQDKSWTWQNCHPFGPKARADFSRFEKLRVEMYAPRYRMWTYFAVEAWLMQLKEEIWALQWLFMEKFRGMKMAGKKKFPQVELAFLGAPRNGHRGGLGRWWKESPSALVPITGKEFDQDERAEVSELLRTLNNRYLSVGLVFVLDPVLDHELTCAHRARDLLKGILEG